MLNQIVMALIWDVCKPGASYEDSRRLARALGAEEILIILNFTQFNILPVPPAFPKDFPNDSSWKEFISGCAESPCAKELTSPFSNKRNYTTGVKGSDGSVLVLIGGNPSYAQMKEVSALVPLVIEASMNRKTVQENNESSLFQSIFQNNLNPIILLDNNFSIQFLNSSAENIIGWSQEEIKGKLGHTIYPEELKIVKNARANFYKKSGEKFPVIYSLSFSEANKDIPAYVLEFRDISDEDVIENKLIEVLKERDQSLLVLSTINQIGQKLISELKLEKLVQEIVDAATQLCGAQFGALFYKKSKPRGESLLLYVISGAPVEAFSKFPQPRDTAVFHPTFAGEGTIRCDDITKDVKYGKNPPYNGMPAGHLPVKSYLAVSIVAASGEVIGALFFGHEKAGVFTEQSQKIVEGLTAQAAVAMDNARLYEDLEIAVKSRDEFLSIVSHELKTPVTSLKLQEQMRKRKIEKGEIESVSASELIKMVNADIRQIDRLSRLIDDVLDLSRIRTGRLSIKLEKTELCFLVNNVLSGQELIFEQTKSEIIFSECEKTEGYWDRMRIEQVVINLLSNAIRYGEGKPIEISVRKSGNLAILKIRDHGIGIAKKDQERIFESFERAMTREISGLGLGLFIVKQILDIHDGKILVESEPGKGSCFTVELPLNQNKTVFS